MVYLEESHSFLALDHESYLFIPNTLHIVDSYHMFVEGG